MLGAGAADFYLTFEGNKPPPFSLFLVSSCNENRKPEHVFDTTLYE
jgi:hypothetical protein